MGINVTRQDEILSLLQEKKYITVADLSNILHLSQSSVRRDLQTLQAKGVIHRHYGGVSLAVPDLFNVPYSMRLKICSKEKKLMAAKAAKLIKDNETIFLPASTTTLYLAQELIHKKGLTIITNDIQILHFFADYHQIKVICPGGTLDPEDHFALVGYDTIRSLEKMRADWAFFSPQTMDNEGVLFDYYREQVAVSMTMLHCARHRVCLCDNSKIGKISSFVVNNLEAFDYLISDVDLHSKYGKQFPQLRIL